MLCLNVSRLQGCLQLEHGMQFVLRAWVQRVRAAVVHNFILAAQPFHQLCFRAVQVKGNFLLLKNITNVYEDNDLQSSQPALASPLWRDFWSLLQHSAVKV